MYIHTYIYTSTGNSHRFISICKSTYVYYLCVLLYLPHRMPNKIIEASIFSLPCRSAVFVYITKHSI